MEIAHVNWAEFPQVSVTKETIKFYVYRTNAFHSPDCRYKTIESTVAISYHDANRIFCSSISTEIASIFHQDNIYHIWHKTWILNWAHHSSSSSSSWLPRIFFSFLLPKMFTKLDQLFSVCAIELDAIIHHENMLYGTVNCHHWINIVFQEESLSSSWYVPPKVMYQHDPWKSTRRNAFSLSLFLCLSLAVMFPGNSTYTHIVDDWCVQWQ